MFSPSLLPSLFVSLSPSLTLWNCHPVPLCVHMYSDELEERREGRITEPYSVDVLCVAARVECPPLTLRHWEWCLVTHGSCACPVCPSFLCAREAWEWDFPKAYGHGFLQMLNGVFVSKLGLCFPLSTLIRHQNSSCVRYLCHSYPGHLIFLPCSHMMSWGVDGRSVDWTQGQSGQWVLLPTWCGVLGVGHW